MLRLRAPQASTLVPLLLVSPVLSLGPYDLSVGEVLVVFAGAVILLSAGLSELRLPRLLLVYLALFTLGRVTSLLMAPGFGIPVGIERLSFLYLVTLPILAYLVGRRSTLDLEAIVTTRFATWVMLALAIFAAAYPFMDVATRKAILIWFVRADYLESARYDAPRFPGIGLNANIYAFLIFVVVLFAFNAYLKGRATLAVTVLGLVVLFNSASRLSIVMTVAGCGLLWARGWVTELFRPGGYFGFSRRTLRLAGYGVLLLAVGAATLRLAGQETLATAADRLVVLQRFASLQSSDPAGEDAVGDRMSMWKMGMARVALAPVMGVAIDTHITNDRDALYFNAPHNEFIFYWTAYGFAGLLAHVVLLVSLMVTNVHKRADPVWLLLYFGLAMQMMFDGALQYVRFIGFFFIIVGLNVSQWSGARSAPGGPGVGAAAGSLGVGERVGGLRPA